MEVRSRMEGRISKDVKNGWRGEVGWRRGMEGRIRKEVRSHGGEMENGEGGWRERAVWREGLGRM
jgi:hypothetical protein